MYGANPNHRPGPLRDGMAHIQGKRGGPLRDGVVHILGKRGEDSLGIQPLTFRQRRKDV